MNFKKHYTRDEARELLPQIRGWLERLSQLRAELTESELRLAQLTPSGEDLGGRLVNDSLRTLAETREILREFQTREIQIKDIDRGLIDFPSFLAGKEIFLCWEKDEDDIEYWHDLESGYAGREPLQS
jgi:hypothetical protein